MAHIVCLSLIYIVSPVTMLPVAENALTRGRDAWNKTHGLSCMSMDHCPLGQCLLSRHFSVIQEIFPYVPNVIFVTVTTCQNVG